MTPARSLFRAAMALCVVSSAPAAGAQPDASEPPSWTARVEMFRIGTGGVFYRISGSCDVGLSAEMSWGDFDHDASSESPTDPQGDGTSGRETSDYTVTLYPELRKWSDLWGASEELGVRSYWGLRLRLGASRSEQYWLDDSLSSFRTTDVEEDGWSTGLALTLGVEAHVWKPISLAIAMVPLEVTYRHERRLRTEFREQGPPSDDYTVTRYEDTNRYTNAYVRVEPALHAVISW